MAAYDLPVRPPGGFDAAELTHIMGRDKKAGAGGLAFVLDGPAGLQVVPGIDPAVVTDELAGWLA